MPMTLTWYCIPWPGAGHWPSWPDLPCCSESQALGLAQAWPTRTWPGSSSRPAPRPLQAPSLERDLQIFNIKKEK